MRSISEVSSGHMWNLNILKKMLQERRFLPFAHRLKLRSSVWKWKVFAVQALQQWNSSTKSFSSPRSLSKLFFLNSSPNSLLISSFLLFFFHYELPYNLNFTYFLTFYHCYSSCSVKHFIMLFLKNVLDISYDQYCNYQKLFCVYLIYFDYVKILLRISHNY